MPASLSRLYIIRDNDASGRRAARALSERAAAAGIETIVLKSRLGDFNDDLRVFGPEALKAALRVQIAPEDARRFMILA
jgi:ABC-type sugar transport system substrate-binding protein